RRATSCFAAVDFGEEDISGHPILVRLPRLDERTHEQGLTAQAQDSLELTEDERPPLPAPEPPLDVIHEIERGQDDTQGALNDIGPVQIVEGTAVHYPPLKLDHVGGAAFYGLAEIGELAHAVSSTGSAKRGSRALCSPTAGGRG